MPGFAQLGHIALVKTPRAVRVRQLRAFVKDQGITTLPLGSGKAALFAGILEFVKESTRTHHTLRMVSELFVEGRMTRLIAMTMSQ